MRAGLVVALRQGDGVLINPGPQGGGRLELDTDRDGRSAPGIAQRRDAVGGEFCAQIDPLRATQSIGVDQECRCRRGLAYGDRFGDGTGRYRHGDAGAARASVAARGAAAAACSEHSQRNRERRYTCEPRALRPPSFTRMPPYGRSAIGRTPTPVPCCHSFSTLAARLADRR